MFSSTSSARPSIGNGGGVAMRRISTRHSPISTSPVGRLGFVVPSGRTRTTPVTRTTYSLRTSTALSTTHWTTPEKSRTSTNARCSPCSLRRATHPHNDTVSPTFAWRSSPHKYVRIEVRLEVDLAVGCSDTVVQVTGTSAGGDRGFADADQIAAAVDGACRIK